MLKKSKQSLAFLFGGIGGARNLYATIIEIDRLERNSRDRKKTYQATINDVKANALTRDLVMFYLLDESSAMENSRMDTRTEVSTTMFYLFAGAIMPRAVSVCIRATMHRVITALRTGEDALDWVYIYESDSFQLIRSLTS